MKKTILLALLMVSFLTAKEPLTCEAKLIDIKQSIVQHEMYIEAEDDSAISVYLATSISLLVYYMAWCPNESKKNLDYAKAEFDKAVKIKKSSK